jgi:hypothetical protein
MEEEGIEFELVAASLRADSDDSRAFLAALATKLTGALPDHTRVREGGGLFGKKRVSEIEVDLGETRLTVADRSGRLVATRSKAVRGIVLKNEEIPLDEWIDILSEAVTQQATSTEQGRLALQRMLESS